MSTSLAEQLKRLQRPQTSQFVDLRSKASILFDAKEAAEKDREQIYEIGCSGLQELCRLNSDFERFESTLFDRSSKDLVRSIETVDVNKLLNRQIRKFLFHLSPYFMLQPAHKCLEWLIRRFSIESYNRDDFLMLILPYYGTRMFVRCLQIVEVNGTHWAWLENAKRTGTPLAKQTLFNHVGTDPAMIQMMTKTVLDAVKALETKAFSLQTLYGFYCTTILGAMDNVANINETHFMNIAPALLKGLSSHVADFTAATFIICAHLFSKITLASDTLDAFVMKIVRVSHASLHEDAILLLMVLFQTQAHHYRMMPKAALDTIVQTKWFLNSLSEIHHVRNIRITHIYVPLLSVCLRQIQEKSTNDMAYRQFCESLLADIALSDADDTAAVIQCALSSYILTEKVDDVITIDSGDESDIPLSDTNLDVCQWYSMYLKTIERQYPDALQLAMKQILAVGNKSISEQRKSSLKAVLGFILTDAVITMEAGDGATKSSLNALLFENLFHHQSKYRVEAVKKIVRKLATFQSASEKTQSLIKIALNERLSDDDPRVVEQVLKLATNDLIDQIGETDFLTKCLYILNRVMLRSNDEWAHVKMVIVRHLANFRDWTTINGNDLFLELFPMLVPRFDNEVILFDELTKSTLANEWSILRRLAERKRKEGANSADDVASMIMNEVGHESPQILPLNAILEYCEKADVKKNCMQIYFALRMIRFSKGSGSVTIQNGKAILAILAKYTANKEMVSIEHIQNISTKEVPLILIITLLTNLITCSTIQLVEPIHWNLGSSSIELTFAAQIFEIILRSLFHDDPVTTQALSKLMGIFAKQMFGKTEDFLSFLANYFMGHKVINNPIDADLQMMAIRLTNAVLRAKNISISEMTLLKILMGLHHETTIIKKQVLKTISLLAQMSKDAMQQLLDDILRHSEEIVMDNEQVGFVLFNFVTPKTVAKKTASAKSGRALLIDNFINIIVNSNTPNCLKANALVLLRHINDADILTKLSICVANIFGKEKVEAKFRYLSRDEMTIIEEIVLRMNQFTVKVDAKKTQIWTNVVEKILLNADYIYKQVGHEETIESPLVKLLDVIDEIMFSKLPLDNQQRLIMDLLQISVANPVDHQVDRAIGKLIKAMPVNGKHIVAILDAMSNVATTTSTGVRRMRRLEFTSDALLTDEWKMGVLLLEYIQHKRDLDNYNQLLATLFDILKRCTDLEEQNPVEYSKQLLLATILQCCQQMTINTNKVVVADDCLKVDLVVNCIRGSHNPQTHHNALQLICHLARIVPELVLQNITDIFTFMGSSIVRQDDAYSFQIIPKIIESVVPIIITKSSADSDKLVAVLKIFTDIILDVPEHRRHLLYHKLFTVLDAERHMWIFIALILATHVIRGDHKTAKTTTVATVNVRHSHQDGDMTNNRDELPKMIRVAMSIATDFDPCIVIETCCKLIDFFNLLPGDADEQAKVKNTNKKQKDMNSLELAIFNPQNSTTRQLRFMRYAIVQFISRITTSVDFVNRIQMKVSDADLLAIKPYYQKFIIKELMCIAATAKLVDQFAAQKYWKVILNHCYDGLHNIMILLSNQLFVAVVEGLLQHASVTVRKRMLDLLVMKLHKISRSDLIVMDGSDQDTMNQDGEAFMRLLVPLKQQIVQLKHGAAADVASANKVANETLMLQQSALISVKLLAKLLAHSCPDAFADIQCVLIKLLDDRHEIPVVVLASQVLCIAELSVRIGASSIGHLPTIVPIFLEILRTQTNALKMVDTMLISTVTAMQRLIESFALFMATYLIDILVLIALVQVKLNRSLKSDNYSDIMTRITGVCDKIARLFPLRLLVPAMESAYSQLILKKEDIEAVSPLMAILAKSFGESVPTADLQIVHHDLSNFFLNALQFRSKYAGVMALPEVVAIEDQIMGTLVSLILKLSETTFKPLYYKIYDWGVRDAVDQIETRDRTITFYRLSSEIAKALKSLFVLFSIDFVRNSADLLENCNPEALDDNQLWFPNDRDKCAVLLDGLINTYLNIFTYDCKQFMNADRFEMLCKPLVDQLENPIVLNDPRLTEALSKTIAKMGGAIDDHLWRQLNYAIMMKTRHREPKVRLLSIRTCVEFARLIGEEYQSLLPETIPFISELLEDENAEVEKGCQRCIQDLESVLNDSLQKYL